MQTPSTPAAAPCSVIVTKAIQWLTERQEEFAHWCQIQRYRKVRISDWELVKGFILKENEPFDFVRFISLQHKAIHQMLLDHPQSAELAADPQLRQEMISDWIALHGKENREAEIMHQLYLLEQDFGEFTSRFSIPEAED